jgi:pimeloyl-ACP methyl ester carboxylesterase
MNCDRSIRPKAVLLALVALILAGCAPNEPYRTKGAKTCPLDCGDATIEHHAQEGETYDLAFVEFTERGNVFNRDQMEEVLTYVSGLAHPQREGGDDGVLLVVFVHGWKHSAKPGDPNVDDFRDLLRTAARLSVNGGRRVVGVYVGWRGASVPVWGIEQITYWERKNVAEQVGKGGVTELQTRLEHIVLDTDQPNRNLFLVIGHSFGGASVLYALN